MPKVGTQEQPGEIGEEAKGDAPKLIENCNMAENDIEPETSATESTMPRYSRKERKEAV